MQTRSKMQTLSSSRRRKHVEKQHIGAKETCCDDANSHREGEKSRDGEGKRDEGRVFSTAPPHEVKTITDSDDDHDEGRWISHKEWAEMCKKVRPKSPE